MLYMNYEEFVPRVLIIGPIVSINCNFFMYRIYGPLGVLWSEFVRTRVHT